MDETVLQIIFYVAIFVIYLIFGGKKKKKKNLPKTQKNTTIQGTFKAENQTSTSQKNSKDLLSDFLEDIAEKYTEEPTKETFETKTFHSLEQESINYDKTSKNYDKIAINYDAEAIKNFGDYKVSKNPIQASDDFFKESEKALFKPANRHFKHKKKNEFKGFFKNKSNIKRAVILSEILNRKYS